MNTTHKELMETITNKQMGEYTTQRLPFKNSNSTVFTREPPNLYVVYSYGDHFPMYVYDYQAKMWFGNSDKYSVTTSRHQTMARPKGDKIHMLNTDELKQVICRGLNKESKTS